MTCLRVLRIIVPPSGLAHRAPRDFTVSVFIVSEGMAGPESGIGAWRSLVAHLLWEQRVGGSNPSAPTTDTGMSGHK